MSRRSWFNTAAVILVVTAGAAQAEEKAATTKTPITGVDRSYMDLTVSPCKDFYAYANGAFEKVPIPGEYAAYGVNQEIDDRNFAILKEILENSARTGGPKGSVVQRVGDFYASGMDEAAIDREGLRPLTPWLSRIQAITSPEELVAVIAQLQAQGLNVGFHLDVEIDDKDTTTHDRGLQSGRPRPAGARLLFSRGEKCGGHPHRLRGAHRPHARTGRGRTAVGQGDGRFHHGLGNQAGESLSHPRGTARPREELQQVPAGRPNQAGPRPRLGLLFRRDRVSTQRNQRAGSPAGVLHGLRQPAHLRAAGGLAQLPALAPPVRNGQLSQQAVCGGAFLLLRKEALRRHGTAAALEARAGRGGCGHRRGFGPALRAEGVQSRRQGPRPDHGELSSRKPCGGAFAPPSG